MFRDRHEAGRLLAERLKGRPLQNPLVLAIPRGGVVVGAVLADELGAELDVVLSRKLRAPLQPELAIGAISENGEVYLNPNAEDILEEDQDYLHREQNHQLHEIACRHQVFRHVRPQANCADRSVIVTDDGIATGSTMMAALQLLRQQHPHELILAAPVAPADRLADLRRLCDEVLCLHSPQAFFAIGQFYEDFSPVEDQRVVQLLREHGTAGEHGAFRRGAGRSSQPSA